MSGSGSAAARSAAAAAVLLCAVACTGTAGTPTSAPTPVPAPASSVQYPQVNPPTPQLFPVESVYDGDTLRVQTPSGASESVRVLGIDAPELKAPPGTPASPGGSASASAPEDLGRYPECGAVEARDEARALLQGKSVQLAADPEQGDKDRYGYGRLLRYVSLPDGRDLAAELLRTGRVQVYTEFPVSRTPDYLRVQQTARDAELGGWATCGWSQ